MFSYWPVIWISGEMFELVAVAGFTIQFNYSSNHPSSLSSSSLSSSIFEGDKSTKSVTPIPTIKNFLQRRIVITCLYVMNLRCSRNQPDSLLGTVEKFNTVGLCISYMTKNLLF
jgi:hypothetical protein